MRGSLARGLGAALFLAGIIGCSEAPPAGTSESHTGATGDYLGTELRARVEQLIADAASTPTDAGTLAARVRTLSDWIDAYSLAGHEISINTWGLRAVASMPPEGQAALARAAEVDRIIAEYTLRDREPNAIGTLAAESLGPFEARSYATLRQTYTVGSRPVKVGGGFWIARHFQLNYGDYQTTDPTADGYVSVTTDDSDARFVAETIQAIGPHGGFRGATPALAFRVEGGDLDPGARVTFTYGDTAGGARGLLMPDVSSELLPFPIYVDLDGSDYWFNLPLQRFVMTGTRVEGVHAFAPSIVATGESFELAIRAQDHYFNRATGPIPAFDVLVNGEVRTTVPAGTESITVVPMQLDTAGVYHVTIRSADGSIRGEGNPILVEDDPSYRLYWGDTHGHSGFAEGIGTVDYYMRFARDDARLDFVTHSEHDVALDAGEWKVMRETVAAYDAPGRFIPYLGWEWTVAARYGGHHNVLLRRTDAVELISALDYPTLSRLYQGLRNRFDARDVVVIPHAHNPGDYRHSDPALEPLVEIMSMHGTFEWFAHAYLSHGHEIGFVAASDDHLSHPGYSAPKNTSLAQRGGLGAVLAAERTRDAIFDGMKAHRTVATTGDRIILDVSLNGAGIGERAPFSTTRRLEGRVIGTAPIESISVVKNEREIWQRDYLTEATSAGGEQRFLLSFHSDPTPFHERDMPRGWRHWRGALKVEGATLASIEGMDFVNRDTQSLRVDGNTATFATHTRGDTSSLELTLRGVTAGTAIVLELEEARETGGAPPVFRPQASIPGGEVRLALGQLQRGQLVHPMPFENYADGIVLRRMVSDGPRDLTFEVVDETDPRQGDHYYVRVRQANDAIAWSSPIWVGGFREQ